MTRVRLPTCDQAEPPASAARKADGSWNVPRCAPKEVGCEAAKLFSLLLGLLRLLDRVVDLPAMNRHLFGRFNAKPNLAATYFNYGDDDVLVDDDALVLLSG